MSQLTLAGAFFGSFHNLAALACAERYVSFDYIQHQTQVDVDTLRFVLHDLKTAGLVQVKKGHGEMYKTKHFTSKNEIKRLPWQNPPSKPQLALAYQLAGVA
jgi:hypothetical protein